jgi:hypothetical protein
MTAEQFRRAYAIAMSKRDLSNVNFDALCGYGLSDFNPVTVPIEAVARCIRWQTQQFDGGIDGEALTECRRFFVYPSRRVEVLESEGCCPHCGQPLVA